MSLVVTGVSDRPTVLGMGYRRRDVGYKRLNLFDVRVKHFLHRNQVVVEPLNQSWNSCKNIILPSISHQWIRQKDFEIKMLLWMTYNIWCRYDLVHNSTVGGIWRNKNCKTRITFPLVISIISEFPGNTFPVIVFPESEQLINKARIPICKPTPKIFIHLWRKRHLFPANEI